MVMPHKSRPKRIKALETDNIMECDERQSKLLKKLSFLSLAKCWFAVQACLVWPSNCFLIALSEGGRVCAICIIVTRLVQYMTKEMRWESDPSQVAVCYKPPVTRDNCCREKHLCTFHHTFPESRERLRNVR